MLGDRNDGAWLPRNVRSLNGFQTSRCRLQAKIITRNLEIFGDVSA
ncbi:hypothetical protein BURMUCF2_A1306 [Burkholderia multivorans CF2]|nr:hypothetical protein BURMUCF2_A1306 [Burkholderia multivorans CF2]